MIQSRDRREIKTIDCEYLRREFAAAYLLIDGEQAAFIDNNTAHSVPLLLKSLESSDLSPEQVRYIIVTHVHLDHSGGTSALLKACPNATVVVHPRGARHLIDPEKLIRSAEGVYGKDRFNELYGSILPIPAERILSGENALEVPFGKSAPLRLFHTRGHANHHFCVEDPENGVIFTGDSFGLIYPALQKYGLLAIPSTSPTDFHAEEALKSIEEIISRGPLAVYPTHFGRVTRVTEAAAQLKEQLNASAEILQTLIHRSEAGDALASLAFSLVTQALDRFLSNQKIGFGADDYEYLRMDLELNAQGLAYVAEKKRRDL